MAALLLVCAAIVAYQRGSADTPPLPSSIPISDETGVIIGEQPPDLQWVLVSGVDEHGLIAEHEVTLLSDAAVDAPITASIYTGAPATINEIRQGGPQNLRRFYHVTLVDGRQGWTSDYYIRRLAYLFDETRTAVALYAAPDGTKVGEVANVTPVVLRDATQPDWWLVQTVDNSQVGWVPASMVKESSEPEFLTKTQHDHP